MDRGRGEGGGGGGGGGTAQLHSGCEAADYIFLHDVRKNSFLGSALSPVKMKSTMMLREPFLSS